MEVVEAVVSRRSIRAFLPTPVPLETLHRVLEAAQMAPSGCNFQPWEGTVLTGAPLKALQDKLLASESDDPREYDFSAPGEVPKYKARLREMGAKMYGALQVEREDTEKRLDIAAANLTSFGAPVLLLCHFPKLMKEPQWSDVGMWLQTVMLLLRGEGLDSCPQEWMGLYGRTIKAHLGLDMEATMLFCGLAIGYRDASHPVNSFPRSREPLDSVIDFQGFA